MPVGRSEHGRIERQKILDFMHRVGRPATCREISDAVGQTSVATISRLSQMRTHGEAESIQTVVGNTPTKVYMPLVLDTAVMYAPNVVVVVVVRKKAPSREKAATVITRISPGYVFHNGMNRDHPIPDQRGQGALGPRGPRGATCLEQNA